MDNDRKKVKDFYESYIIVYKMYKLLNNNYLLDDNKILDPDALNILIT